MFVYEITGTVAEGNKISARLKMGNVVINLGREKASENGHRAFAADHDSKLVVFQQPRNIPGGLQAVAQWVF